MHKGDLPRWILKRLPVGFSAAPFEFVFMLGYAFISGKYLLDIATGSEKRDLVSLAALPMHGATLDTWLVIIFLGAASTCVGLLINGYRLLLGLRLERAGLSMAGSMIAFYIVQLYSVVGFQFGIGFITVFGLMFATAYKVVLIGQALDALTERRKGS